MSKFPAHILLALLCLMSITRLSADAQATSAHLRKPMVNPVDDPGLPNVLIIGDSISIGYTLAVRKLLRGRADVFRPPTNCQYSAHGAANMRGWLGTTKWDVIHFNFGIWDVHCLRNGILVLDQAQFDKNELKRRITTSGYVENLARIIESLKTSDAKLIWASTTPWVSYGDDTKALIARNNSAAAELMKKEGVAINDLYGLALPQAEDWLAEDGVHFRRSGYEQLAKQVAASISAALRPNIVLMIADDMSAKDWGVYGNTFAKTPNIDAAARQGVTFTNAFCSSPVCHPARSVLLTGQEVWRLRDAAIFGGTLHEDITTYVDLLEPAGYDVAYSGKGWGPGVLEPGGRTSPPTGRRANLANVLDQADKKPFCFWWGTTLGHREFTYRPDGRSLDGIELPPYIPDTPAVRKDYAGYYQEVEAFDAEVGKVIQLLEKAGVAENTMLIITSDHGMPWPRGKGRLYDLGPRVPLIVHWPARVKPGRVLDDFVDFTDFAPTFLEAAQLPVPVEMTGDSLLPLLKSQASGTIDAERDRAFLGLESHPTTGPYEWWLGYMSCRAIRTADFLYIRNYSRDGHVGWKPTQAGPIVDILQTRMRSSPAAKHDYDLCFGLRPKEELYDIKTDPHQLRNLAPDPNFAAAKRTLNAALSDYMKATDDPRATSNGKLYPNYPVWCSKGGMGGYNRSGELEIFPIADYEEWIKENLK